jgi:hypothetical protein
MKIGVNREKIIKAVKHLEGIEVVLENSIDAYEAISLILAKPDLFKNMDRAKLKDIKVTALQEYKTSAVDYEVTFLLDFSFEEHVPLGIKVAIIKELQEFFDRI